MSLSLNAIPHNINHAAQTPNALDTIMTVCVHNVHIVATDPPFWRLDRPGPETTSFAISEWSVSPKGNDQDVLKASHRSDAPSLLVQ